MICHQDPGRLVSLHGRLILLCPRCAGLHLGVTLSQFFLPLFGKERVRIAGILTRSILAAAIGLLAVHWLGERLELYASTAGERIVSGLSAGSALGVLLNAYRRNFIQRSPGRIRSLGTLHLGLQMSLVLAAGLAINKVSDWGVLSSILLFCVGTNVLTVLYTLVVRVNSRFLNHQS